MPPSTELRPCGSPHLTNGLVVEISQVTFMVTKSQTRPKPVPDPSGKVLAKLRGKILAKLSIKTPYAKLPDNGF